MSHISILHYNMRKFIISAAIFFGIIQMHAQSVLTLDEAIAAALRNNYDIILAKNDSAVAALDYEYRNAVFLPRINGTLGTNWTNNNQKQEFTTGNNREGNVATGNVNAAINLNWTLFDGGKMFVARKIAQEYIRLGELEIKNQVINTVAQVVNTYYNIVRQKQQLRAVEEQMSISQTRVDLSRRKLEIGVGAKPELLQSQVDLNAQRAAQLQQLTFIIQLKEQLNHLVNPSLTNGPSNPASTEYDVSDIIPIDTLITVDEIQNGIVSGSPLLGLAQQNIEIAGLELKSLKADRYPIVQFNSAYVFSRTSNDIALNPALPIFNRNRGLNYGFTATIPILNYRNTTRLINQAELNIGFQQLLYENQKSLLHLDVLTAFHEYELEKQSLDLEEDNILLARENVDIILELYRLGSSTYLQLREAQKSLEDAYNRLIAARYNTKLAETELLRLKGEIVK
ncbi:MAG TPA: TolC family protein [Saprospiraceae bacterium]|nr:TolC family protein [Saprospiraceae bacterium]